MIEVSGGGERLGVCLDSCHLLASGYEVRKRAAFKQVVDEYDSVVGLDRLRALHLNDSKIGARFERRPARHPRRRRDWRGRTPRVPVREALQRSAGAARDGPGGTRPRQGPSRHREAAARLDAVAQVERAVAAGVGLGDVEEARVDAVERGARCPRTNARRRTGTSASARASPSRRRSPRACAPRAGRSRRRSRRRTPSAGSPCSCARCSRPRTCRGTGSWPRCSRAARSSCRRTRSTDGIRLPAWSLTGLPWRQVYPRSRRSPNVCPGEAARPFRRPAPPGRAARRAPRAGCRTW